MERGMEEEKKIIDRIQSGDRLAFKQIVESHKKMVYFPAYYLNKKNYICNSTTSPSNKT